MNNVTERFNLIIQAQKYSDQETHDISAMLCWLRDEVDPELQIRIETCLQAFINRKRLGTPFTFKQLREEFNLPS